jgi:hypothetical protein
VLYARGPDRTARALACVVLSAGLWTFANVWADVALTERGVIFWSGMAVIGILCFTTSFLAFVASFTTAHQRPIFTWRLVVALPTLALAPFAFSRLSTVEVFILYTRPAQITLGLLYIPVVIFYYGSIGLAYAKLWRYAQSATATVRAQVLYIVLGTSLTVLGSAVFSIILPVVFDDLRFYSVGSLATIGMLGAISYAILRHRLLDIRVAIQRGIIYTTLLTGSWGFIC